jgi:hypothetical protein
MSFSIERRRVSEMNIFFELPENLKKYIKYVKGYAGIISIGFARPGDRGA